MIDKFMIRCDSNDDLDLSSFKLDPAILDDGEDVNYDVVEDQETADDAVPVNIFPFECGQLFSLYSYDPSSIPTDILPVKVVSVELFSRKYEQD